MSDIRQFFEGTGVAVGMLMALLVMLYRGGTAVWGRLWPRIDEWFGKHFALIESLITRNEQQVVYDETHHRRIGTLMTRRDACRIAGHHCNLIEGLVSGNNEAAQEHLRSLRDEIAKMKDSDADTDTGKD